MGGDTIGLGPHDAWKRMQEEIGKTSPGAHTPGPWTVRGTIVFFPNVAGGFDLRNCPNPEANARIAGAAPDLLAALIMVRDADDDCKRDGLPCMPPCARACVDATIAKATGADFKPKAI